MAEVRNDEEEHALPAKRKPDICSVDKDEDLKKQQKLETCTDNNSSTAEDKKIDEDNDEDDDEEEEDYGGADDDDDDEDEDDEDEDGDEHPNAKAGIDRKGKGIMREDKGKGKLIEESDDSSDGGSESDGDSDLSGDPLAEVDLDNILPSRTRRRAVQPGIYLSNDLGNKKL
uniref:Putative histone H2A.Z-specific chaperone CHZ1 n=1 Tax=Davidia involucrata TaxID=16924 RepID=A0A5B7ATQ6_DAVIN